MGYSNCSVRGFSLVELVAVIAVIASAGAVLGPSFGGIRNQQQGLTSEGKLLAIGQAAAMYGIGNDDRIFSYSWKRGDLITDISTGNTRTMTDDTEAAAFQAQNILLRATGRLEGEGVILPPVTRLMHRRYSHLVLADYMGGNVSDPLWVDPADADLLHWQSNPLEYLQAENSFPYGNGVPTQAGYDTDPNWAGPAVVPFWAFASSYQSVPHAWQSDFGSQYTPTSATPHLFQTTGLAHTLRLGERRFGEVRFPSAKVHMFEEFDREQAGDPYFGYDHAQVAKLMFDGSINTMASGAAQISVSPRDYLEGNRTEWRQKYVPLDTFPVPLGGLGDETLLSQRFRWTLGGLQGVNYQRTIMPGGRR